MSQFKTLPKSTSNVKTNDKKLSTNVQVVLSKVSTIITESSSFIGCTNLGKMKTLNDESVNNLAEVGGDLIDEIKFYSACNLENLKNFAKKTKINLFSSNGNTSEDGMNSTSEQSLTDKEETSPKYNTRSSRIANNKNQQKNSQKKHKLIVRKNSIDDAEYLKKLDDNTTSLGQNEDYDSEFSNISKNQDISIDSRSRVRTRKRTKTQQSVSSTKKAKQKIQNFIKYSTKTTLTSNSSRSSSSRSSSINEMINIDSQGLPDCGKAHCRLGCICEALQVTGNTTNTRGSISSNSGSSTSGGSSNNNITKKNNSITSNYTNNNLNNGDINGYRDHCGRFECMFECTCTRRLRSTTRNNVRRSSNNSENNSSNGFVSKTKNKKGTKKTKPSRVITTPSTSKKSRGISDKEAERSSSQSSARSSSSKERSSTRSSSNHDSSEDDSNKEDSSVSESTESSSSSSSEESSKEGASKVRKSKRVKHLIKKAAASSNQANKKSHHSGSQKFEDNYYYYYYANNHQLTNKTIIKTKSNNPKTSNDIVESPNKDSNEETTAFSGQSKKTCKTDQSNHNKHKHKTSNQLNKKDSNNHRDDFTEAFERLANLKKLPSYKKPDIQGTNQFQDIEETAISHNGDDKENYTKEVDANFKPYTQNTLLHIPLKSSTSNSNDQTKSLPVRIEVLTSKWCEKLSRKLLDTVFDPIQPKWKELEFDYDNEITIKLFSSNRITNNKVFQFKVDESSDTSEYSKSISLLILRCRRENNTSKSFINTSDSRIKLISDFISLHGNGSSILIDLKTHEHSDINCISNKNDNTSKDPTRNSAYIKYPLAPTKTTPYSSTNTKPFSLIPNKYRPILPASSPFKNLPRLLCRNRSFNDAGTAANTKGLNSGGSFNGSTESGQNLNQTGILFKKVEILFEKIKSSPTLDQTTANLLSKMISFSSPKHTKISQKLLEFRPKKLVNNSLNFKDEQSYFKNTKKMSYDFYDPFSDKSLILDLYNKPNYTRDFVDTVCTVVNNMVNVVSIANNDKVASNNTKMISTESLSKPNKTITILPKPSNMATSNTQVLNSILSKPSVIIINNNNNQNLNTTISPGSIPTSNSNILADFNKKVQNPFITAIKSSLNSNIQQQTSQSESHPKTIVKLISTPDILNTSNSQMFKVSSNSHSSNTTLRNTTFTPLLPSSSSTNSRPLILKSIPKSSSFSASNPLKLGNPNGFSPIKPKSDIFLPNEENTKIIKLTNGQQYKYLNTSDLLSNLKTTNMRQGNTAQQFQAKPPTLTLINVKTNTSKLFTIDSNEEQNESRKRKRKQDLSSLSLKPTNENTNLAQSQQEKNMLEKYDALRHEDISAIKKRGDFKLAHNKFNNHLNRSTSHFKVSASLFKLKKSSNAVNENPHDDDEAEGEYDDDDDFLDDGISDEEDEEDGMVSKSLKENEFNGFGDDDDDVYTKSISSASCFSQEKKMSNYKSATIRQYSSNSGDSKEEDEKALQKEKSTCDVSKRARSRKPSKPNHMNFKFDPHDFEDLKDEDDEDEEMLEYDALNDEDANNDYIEKDFSNNYLNSKRSVNNIETKFYRKSNTNTNRDNTNSFKLKKNMFNDNNYNNNKHDSNNNDDSFDSNDNRQSSSNNLSLSISSSSSDDMGDDENYFDYLNNSNVNENGEEHLESVSYPRSHVTKKPISNSLHSIKERERRDTLKKLFTRLKLSMFKLSYEVETPYYEDAGIKLLKEELNTTNSNPRMKSKQRTLLEAVQNIHLLERSEANLLSVLEEQKLYNNVLIGKLTKLQQK